MFSAREDLGEEAKRFGKKKQLGVVLVFTCQAIPNVNPSRVTSGRAESCSSTSYCCNTSLAACMCVSCKAPTGRLKATSPSMDLHTCEQMRYFSILTNQSYYRTVGVFKACLFLLTSCCVILARVRILGF